MSARRPIAKELPVTLGLLPCVTSDCGAAVDGAVPESPALAAVSVPELMARGAPAAGDKQCEEAEQWPRAQCWVAGCVAAACTREVCERVSISRWGYLSYHVVCCTVRTPARPSFRGYARTTPLWAAFGQPGPWHACSRSPARTWHILRAFVSCRPSLPATNKRPWPPADCVGHSITCQASLISQSSKGHVSN